MANSIRHTMPHSTANHVQRQHHASYGSHYTTAPSFYQETQFSAANNANFINWAGASLLLLYGSSMAVHGYQPYHQSMHHPAVLYASHGYHAHPYLHYYNYQSLRPQLYVPMVGVAETLSIVYEAHLFANQQQQQLEEETLFLDEDGELVNFNGIISPDEDVSIESMDVFQNLKTRTYAHDELEGKADKDEGGDTCVVCQQVYENNETIATLQCGHEYHAECKKRWLSTNSSCPICRAKV